MSDDHLDQIRAQFTRQADAYSSMPQTADEQALELLVRVIAPDPQEHVLDVCCGPGFLTMTFARHCAAVTGLDATDEFIRRAEREAARRGLTNVDFHLGDAERLPFESGRFDIVSCRAAFHHLVHPEHVLREMQRVAKRGGRLLIADMLTDPDPVKAEYHNRVERLCDPTHVRALTEDQFARLFAAAGLEVRQNFRRSLDFDVDGWMAHGGPTPEASRRIVELMEASLDVDRGGLNVRREDGVLRFSYGIGVYVLQT